MFIIAVTFCGEMHHRVDAIVAHWHSVNKTQFRAKPFDFDLDYQLLKLAKENGLGAVIHYSFGLVVGGLGGLGN